MTHQIQSNELNAAVQLLANHGFEGMANAMQILFNAAMKIERSEYLNVEPYQRTEERKSYANGFKDKTVNTRLGKLELRIPQTRDSEFYPSALERGERSERTLKLAVAEMYVQGVSTRKVAKITAELCGLKGSGKQGQPLYDRLWGSGFLPSVYQGVKFRNQGAPVLDIYDPPGVSRDVRRKMLDQLAKLNELKYEAFGDPEIETRIQQYELAFQMQRTIPELLDTQQETKATLDLYGSDVHRQGSYAYNCLLARRLAERGVRFIQLFHQGWDQHVNLPNQIRKQCRDTDQATAALLSDLKSRGMLEDTLIVWGGEFGRTVYSQGALTKANYGRDHHGHCFSVWLAGGGIQGGMTYGATDDYSVNVVENPVNVHDLHATLLHLLGIDHERLIFPFQGRDYRLTDVHGKVVRDILA